MEFSASHSRVEAFRRCEQLHYYSYGERLTTVGNSEALVRGSAFHEGLATYYQGIKEGLSHGDAAAAGLSAGIAYVYANSVARQDTLLAEVVFLLTGYFEYAEQELDRIEVLEVEKKFEVQVTKEFSMVIIIDLILRYDGVLEAWDHKCVYDFYNKEYEDLSPQLPLYYSGLKLLGYPNVGLRYNEVRYRDTSANAQNFPARIYRPSIRMSPTRALTTMDEHIRVARRMANLQQMGLEAWRSIIVRRMDNKICRNCSFKKLCIADLQGEDRTLYIGYDFKQRESR